MNILIVVGIIVVVLVVTQLTLFKTLYLIVTVAPYEQKGNGTQSLLVLGDSTGYGTGTTNSQYSVAGRIGAEYPSLTITNNSVNGRTIGELRKDIENLSGQYDVILLQIGANDILQKRPLETVVEDLNATLDALAPRAKKIVMIASGNVGGAVRFKGTEKAAHYQQQSVIFKEAFFAIQSERDYFTYVDLYVDPSDDPFVLEPEIYTANDGLHPSNQGYEIWFHKVKPAVTRGLTQ